MDWPVGINKVIRRLIITSASGGEVPRDDLAQVWVKCGAYRDATIAMVNSEVHADSLFDFVAKPVGFM